jgi:hypothetical protein
MLFTLYRYYILLLPFLRYVVTFRLKTHDTTVLLVLFNLSVIHNLKISELKSFVTHWVDIITSIYTLNFIFVDIINIY